MHTPTITQEAFDGLMRVRDSGATNMFDVKTVIQIAEMMGEDDTVEWLTSPDNFYMDFMMTGEYTIKE